MNINNMIPRISDICIKNNNELINNTNDDFHYVIYFLDKNKIKVIIRRLDSDEGWGVNLSIKIFSLNGDNDEIISIGSSDKNCKKTHIYTSIDIFPLEYTIQKIPKIIFQTTFSKNIDSIYHYNSILTYIELNPEYEYRLFDDKDCREFIKKNYDDNTLQCYDLLIPGAFRADFFRYCFLYINGGCYFDCKSILRKPLRQFINSNDTLLLCKDIGPGYYNAMMMSEKKNENLLNVINSCKTNISNFFKIYNINDRGFNHADNILSLTGPILLFNSINRLINKNDVIKFYHKDIRHHFHHYKRLCVEYQNGEYFLTKQFINYIPFGNHYSELWYRREILYKLGNDKFNNNFYKYYIFIGNAPDNFNFYIINERTLIIERTDSNNGWGNHLKIKIVDEEKNIENKVDIGNSNSKYKLYVFSENIFDCSKINLKYESFKNIDYNFNDTFNITIFMVKKYKYKLIVIRTDSNEGWGQDLRLNIVLNNGKELNVHVGNSSNNIKIINIDNRDTIGLF